MFRFFLCYCYWAWPLFKTMFVFPSMSLLVHRIPRYGVWWIKDFKRWKNIFFLGNPHVSGLQFFFIPFWAAVPTSRCPVEHRREFPDIRPSVLPSLHPSILLSLRPSILPSLRPNVLPSFHPSVHPSLRWPSGPHKTTPRPQLSSPGFKSALQTSHQPPGFQSAPNIPQICPQDLQSALQTSNRHFFILHFSENTWTSLVHFVVWECPIKLTLRSTLSSHPPV